MLQIYGIKSRLRFKANQISINKIKDMGGVESIAMAINPGGRFEII
jgi:hypothetical protein